MNAFARRAMNTPRFTRSVTNFEKSHMKKTAKEWRVPDKTKALLSPELSNSWAQPHLYHHLAKKTNVRNAAELAVRPKNLRRTTLKRSKRIRIGFSTSSATGKPMFSLLDINHFFQICADN